MKIKAKDYINSKVLAKKQKFGWDVTFSEKKIDKFDTVNINEKVYHLLKMRIINLTYPPKHRIKISELKMELNISQTPLKDALMRLTGEGLIEICSRRGTFVRDVTAKDIREIADTRIILETGAIEIVARQITDDQVKYLEQLYYETLFDENEFDYLRFMETDNQYHLAIIRLANNDTLYEIYKKLNAHIQIVRYKFARHQRKKLDWTDRDHEDILFALKIRNPEKAKLAIRRHLRTARDVFLEGTSESEGNGFLI